MPTCPKCLGNRFIDSLNQSYLICVVCEIYVVKPQEEPPPSGDIDW